MPYNFVTDGQVRAAAFSGKAENNIKNLMKEI
jgi:hypothetical protein